MRLRLIRHATLVVELAGRRLLVDPMLAAGAELPAIEGTPNERPNPLVNLPCAVDELLEGLASGLGERLAIPVDGETLAFRG